tara:strand:- start:2024 stop:2311 length:288 start_codon:yes stop_codon:yes gene_type:complete
MKKCLTLLLIIPLISCSQNKNHSFIVVKSNDEWKKTLTNKEYKILEKLEQKEHSLENIILLMKKEYIIVKDVIHLFTDQNSNTIQELDGLHLIEQ